MYTHWLLMSCAGFWNCRACALDLPAPDLTRTKTDGLNVREKSIYSNHPAYLTQDIRVNNGFPVHDASYLVVPRCGYKEIGLGVEADARYAVGGRRCDLEEEMGD